MSSINTDVRNVYNIQLVLLHTTTTTTTATTTTTDDDNDNNDKRQSNLDFAYLALPFLMR